MRSESVPRLHAHARGTRLVALFVLGVVGTYSANGISPLLTSHCACDHGIEVPCDCPHHSRASSPPAPCHVRLKQQAATAAPAQPCVRAHCGSSRADLLLVGLFSTAERPQLAPEVPAFRTIPLAALPPVNVWLDLPKHPPKVCA